MIDMPGRYFFPALCISLLLAGCASQPQSYVVLLENPDQSAGTIIVKGPKGEHVVNTARHGRPLDESSSPQRTDAPKWRKDSRKAFLATPPLPVHFLLYFDKGGAKLLPDSETLLDKIVELSATRTAIDLSVIGHTDTEGPAELNEGLALKRATAVAEMLKSKGLKARALAIESHGERNLLVKTPDNTPEPRNRRVEVSIR